MAWVIPRSGLLVIAAMAAFAANSLLCRLALKTTAIDPGGFTLVRIAAGAITLAGIVLLRSGRPVLGGGWISAVALVAYAAGFSFAYVRLPAGVGALLLFGAVQVTMIGHAMLAGERPRGLQIPGIAAAILGLVILLLPGLQAPPPAQAALMLLAGAAWGVYSIQGRRSGDPTVATAGNFIRAVPAALLLAVVTGARASVDPVGAVYAVASGALASGVGYALWYAALPALPPTIAATVQLCVPVLAAFGGVIVLDEAITLRLLGSSVAILGGIALVIVARPRRA